MIKEQRNKQIKFNEILHRNNIPLNNDLTKDPMTKINEMGIVINELLSENIKLIDKIKYLEEKITSIITEKIKEKTKEKTKEKITDDNVFNVKTI